MSDILIRTKIHDCLGLILGTMHLKYHDRKIHTMYSLDQLLQQITLGATQLYHQDAWDETDALFEQLCFCPVNDHLNDYSTYHAPSHSFTSPRNHILTGQELITGDFLLLDYCGHLPEFRLSALASLAQLEQQILSSSGIFNPFTTMQIPLIAGQFQSYSIAYQVANEPKQVYTPNDFYQQHVKIGLSDTEFAHSTRQLIWCDDHPPYPVRNT